MNDKPEAVRMMLAPEHPTYEQLAKMSGPWCCTVEEMAESWAELLDNIEATPSQDASALVEALTRIKNARTAMDGGSIAECRRIAEKALTAWEAQHG